VAVVTLFFEVHNSIFCYRYPTKTCAVGNGGVRSSWDNVASSYKDGSLIVRSGCDC